MKKFFTLLSVAAVALSVSAETVILSNPGKVKKNVLSGTELGANVPKGFTLQCMNEAKNLESGSNFTIEGTNYVSIKLSNGAQNTLTLPEGCVATKLTIYSTINKDAATERPCYWKEVAGIDYTADDNHGIIESFKNYKEPNIQSFDIPNLNVVTFTNTGEQPFVALEVTYEESAEADPVFPESINLNTSAEGLVEEQANEDGQIVISLTGEIEESTFDVVLDVPEGWDGFVSMVQSGNVTIGESSSPKLTRADEDDWMSIEDALEFGGEKGNKFTFAATGDRNHLEVYLYKGENVYLPSSITLTANVTKHVDQDIATANQAAYEAVLAQIDEVQKNFDAAVAEIKNLENTNPDFNLEEWEEIGGMIEQYKDYAAQALEAANSEGEEYFFPFSAQEFNYMIAGMLLEATPVPAEAPVLPKTYEVSVSDASLNVEQVVEQDVFTIKVEGKTNAKTVTVKVVAPEGFDGFIGLTDSDYISNMQPFNTRAEDEEESMWVPVSALELIINGIKPCDELTFNVDGDEHYGYLYPVKGNLAWAEAIDIEVNVTVSDGSAVEGINAADSNASYYDLQGNKISTPKAGMYVKVVDGKATKVVVK